MLIRCRSCHGTVWLECESSAARPSASIHCKACGQAYRVDGAHRLGSGERRLSAAARKIAAEHDIDLPGAYAVLFGIMGHEEVREIGHRESSTSRSKTDAAAAAARNENRTVYDRAFQPAVEAGLLTSYQAAERGQREEYALRIATRYGLPNDVALAIADNRVSLLNCLRDCAKGEHGQIVITVPSSPYRPAALAGVMIGVVVALALLFASRSSTPPTAANHTRSVLGAEVRTDQHGQVVRVSARDPRTVLGAYCASRAGSGLAAVSVVPSMRGGKKVRLGLFRKGQDATRVFMIEISEDRAAGQWVAGDGNVPVVAKEAPRGALMDDQVPQPPS